MDQLKFTCANCECKFPVSNEAQKVAARNGYMKPTDHLVAFCDFCYQIIMHPKSECCNLPTGIHHLYCRVLQAEGARYIGEYDPITVPYNGTHFMPDKAYIEHRRTLREQGKLDE